MIAHFTQNNKYEYYPQEEPFYKITNYKQIQETTELDKLKQIQYHEFYSNERFTYLLKRDIINNITTNDIYYHTDKAI